MQMKKVLLDLKGWNRVLEILDESPEGTVSKSWLYREIKRQIEI